MMSRRITLLSLLSGILGAFMGFAPISATKADTHHGMRSAEFIQSLARRAIDSLTSPETARSERIERFRVMFNDNFAVRSMGKRALGRYWRKTTTDERMEYQKLFERLMVITYVDRFANYAGEDLNVLDNRIEDKAIATVFSELRREGDAKSIRVDWIVGTNGTIYKIVDVKVEGISMTKMLASDFSSIIRQCDGQISGLIAELEKKTAQLFAKP